jgi:hypothetical protein
LPKRATFHTKSDAAQQKVAASKRLQISRKDKRRTKYQFTTQGEIVERAQLKTKQSPTEVRQGQLT